LLHDTEPAAAADATMPYVDGLHPFHGASLALLLGFQSTVIHVNVLLLYAIDWRCGQIVLLYHGTALSSCYERLLILGVILLFHRG
jgi:hypothetical protein